jgi:hypothetical protein
MTRYSTVEGAEGGTGKSITPADIAPIIYAIPPKIRQVLAATRTHWATLCVAKVGAADTAPAEVRVTPAPAAKVMSPAPVLIKVIALPSAAAVKVLSGAIVTVLVDALLV